ncbi:hypothetical protein [Tessaracoccus defluvii]|uniref:PHP domain-containing protein n=1 Tax=Tessaracoccus defluvii TaxID=1285901 RepID=A0A7H0H4N9_9ACTN|nr:hypothetical protein [Tessaracoccus defluvii]QNP55505.1 hypothetical protein H9L22_15145 [Tessaracoccus defluvii]
MTRGPFSANTHVHVPPNASSDDTLDSLLAQARTEGLEVIGTSNFFDLQVLPRFVERTRAAGLYPLAGTEVITVDADLEARGWTVNDPQNPGRYYLQGRGLSVALAAAGASPIGQGIRAANDRRAEEQVALMSRLVADAGLPNDVTAAMIAAALAGRSDVPAAWVSLQERHIARAFADLLLGLAPGDRVTVLGRLIGASTDIPDAGDLQNALRAALLKHGRPAFVADSPVPFADGVAHVLALGGIPTYCAVGDGATPICDYEAPAVDLARRIRDAGFHAAELITVRNTRTCVEEYVAAFLDAGLIVMAGSEHNTPNRLPLALTCVDGPIPEAAAAAFQEGTAIVAAHQALVAAGEAGFVDGAGDLVDGGRRTELAGHGRDLIAAALA